MYRGLESVVITTISDCKKFVKKAQKQPKTCQLLPRSPRPSFAYRGHKKIESLIKRVVEKESRERLQRRGPQSSLPYSNHQQTQQRLQICDGIVRSKLQVFDETKRPSRLPKDHKGFVKAKMAIFDGSKTNNGPVSSTTGNAKRLAEKRLLALANAASKSSSNSRISSLQKEFKN